MYDSPLPRVLIVTASIVIILAGMKIAQPILVPVLVAFFLAVLTTPAVSYLVKYKIPTSMAIFLVVALLIGIFIVLGSVLTSSIDQFIQRIPDYELKLQEGLVKLEDRLPWLVNDLKVTISEFKPTESALSLAGTLFSGVGSVLTSIVLILFTLIFTLIESQNASKKLRLALGDDRSIVYVRRFSKLVQRYLLVKSLISLATGLFVGLLLWFLGVDYPILWGAFAFLMNFIPNIGSLLAAIPPVILATIQFDFSGFAMTSLGFIIINLLIGNLLEPRVMGKTLDISPLVVFLSLIFWGWILGIFGMLLAIPLTVVVKIGFEVNPKTKWLAQVISQ